MSGIGGRKVRRIAGAIVLGGVLGALSIPGAVSASEEEAPKKPAAGEAPIVGPASDRLSPTDIAAVPAPVTRLSPPVPPDILRSPCQGAGGCGGSLVPPAPPVIGGGPDQVLPSPPIVLP